MRLLLDVSAVPAEPVGAGIYTWNLAQQLSTKLDLWLYTRRKDASRWGASGAKGIVATAPAMRPARLTFEQLSANKVVRKVGADIWHGPHYTLPLTLHLPRVVTIHDLTMIEHPEWHERSKVLFFGRMIPASIRRASAIICVSEYTAQQVKKYFQPSAPIIIAPHGVDAQTFSTKSQPNDSVLLENIGAREPYVAFAGTFEPRKNIPALIQSFARVRHHHPDLQLVLAGNEGWGTEEVRDAILTNKVATHVLRPGYLDNQTLAALYRHAAVVCYPSLAEGFGLPALEALACGAPLVSTTGSAVEEIVGEAATLVAPDDIDGLTDALEQLCSDPSLARKLGELGPQRARQFTWEASARKHFQAYEEALQ